MSWWLSKVSVPARVFAVLPRERDHSEPLGDKLSAPIRRAAWAREAFDEAEEHGGRVMTLAEKLGREIGLNAAELVSLRRGAVLHDVGKRLLPSSLLYKTGSLTKSEWALMQQHPQLGRDWARQRGFDDRDTLNVILHHHERWDGEGYPMGLRAENIPLGARIAALCDVFDALMSERRYKAAWSLDRTLLHLAERGGSQFDPELTRIFVDKIVVSADYASAGTVKPSV